ACLRMHATRTAEFHGLVPDARITLACRERLGESEELYHSARRGVPILGLLYGDLECRQIGAIPTLGEPRFAGGVPQPLDLRSIAHELGCSGYRRIALVARRREAHADARVLRNLANLGAEHVRNQPDYPFRFGELGAHGSAAQNTVSVDR